MALRTINYAVTVSEISPKSPQYGGIQGDRNVTDIIFTLDTALVTALAAEKTAIELKTGETYTVAYRVDMFDGSGGYYPSESLTPVSDKITYSLENTSIGGTVTLYLIISLIDSDNLEKVILYSYPATIKIDSSSQGTAQVYEVGQQISGAVTQAESAKTSAQNSAIDSANSASDSEHEKEIANFYANMAVSKASEANASAVNASNSAIASSNSALSSATKATESASSAAAALVSENHAKTSETNSATSEANALTYKNAAAGSATEASGYATAALTSASNAAVSATNAATSESNINTTVSNLNAHVTNTANPHNTTKAQVGLGNVENISITNAINTHNTDVSTHADIRTSVATAITTAGANADTKIDDHNISPTAHADKFSLKADKAQEAWITPTLLNGWVNYGSGESNAGYYKDTVGTVRLTGVIKSGTLAATLFTIPIGYRPASWKYFVTYVSGTYSKIKISKAGAVIIESGSTTLTCLDGISFRAEV